MKNLFILIATVLLTGCVSQKFIPNDRYSTIKYGSESIIYDTKIDVKKLLSDNGIGIENISDNCITSEEINIGQSTTVIIKAYVIWNSVKIKIYWRPSMDIAYMSSSMAGVDVDNDLELGRKGEGGRYDLAFAYLVSICDKFNDKYIIK